MLDLAKYILDKISFDENLFIKELKKFIEWTKNEDLDELKDWCFLKYGNVYGRIMINVFNSN